MTIYRQGRPPSVGCGVGRPNDRDDGPPVEVVLRASAASVEVVLRLVAAVECLWSPSEAHAAAATCGRAGGRRWVARRWQRAAQRRAGRRAVAAAGGAAVAAGGAAAACGRVGSGGSGRAAAAAGGAAAAAGRGVYAAGAVGAGGRVGRVRDKVPPIYDGVMCAVVDYYYLRRPRKALVNNS
jgi:hypothetical protein